MENKKQNTTQTPEQITAAEQTPNKGTFAPNLSQMVTDRYKEQRQREKAVDTHIEGMTEQAQKNSNLQGEIIDCCYKAGEITRATAYFMENPPEYRSFDPAIMVDAIIDYIVQIEDFVNRMRF